MRTCKDCLREYRESDAGRREKRQGGAWGRGKWPQRVYHDQPTRCCLVHHAKRLAQGGARRAGLRRATPRWANARAIEAVYRNCIETTLRTGIPHEVDHIVPLNGARVSGLHVHWNLAVIPAAENRWKSNKLIEEALH